jgi:hypothetical protein
MGESVSDIDPVANIVNSGNQSGFVATDVKNGQLAYLWHHLYRVLVILGMKTFSPLIAASIKPIKHVLASSSLIWYIIVFLPLNAETVEDRIALYYSRTIKSLTLVLVLSSNTPLE